MSTTDAVPSKLLAELQEAASKAVTGVRDPEEMRQAARRMDEMREEIRRRHGNLNIVVPAIRDLRGDLPAS